MNILFPHDQIRPVQDDLIKEIQNSIKLKKHMLAHAPTGLGKTAAVLAAVLPYALENNLTVFFLTPRHTQHKIVVDTLRLIKKKHNIDIKVTDFIGKKWMCLQPGANSLTSHEFHEYCREVVEKETCHFYNNMKVKTKKEIALHQINKDNPLHVEQLMEISEKQKLCPFEVSCITAKQSHVIIADYYHILSPSIREAMFKKINKDLSKSIVIFDEAQNLPNRSRDLLTATLSTFVLEQAIKEAKAYGKPQYVEKILEIKNILETFAQEIPIQETEAIIDKHSFISEIENYEEIMANFEFLADEIREVKKRSFIGSISHFMDAWLGLDYGFTRILKKGFSKRGNPFISLSYRCLDPSIVTTKLIDEVYSIICMSGTLTPTSIYKDILGFPDSTIQKEFLSPFPKENKLSLIVPETSTKFTLRSEEMYKRISTLIAEFSNTIPGNIAIFFPSYKLRDLTNKYFITQCKKTTFLEEPNLTKQEKEELLEKFKSYKDVGAVLLGVSSASFAEGIDLPGDYLKAVIVVGLPLAKPDLETKSLINFYDQKFNRGWDYGYIYPSIIKAIQASGRCIRSETDKGIVIFLDERYSWGNYLKCFPQDMNIQISKLPLQKIKEFID